MGADLKTPSQNNKDVCLLQMQTHAPASLLFTYYITDTTMFNSMTTPALSGLKTIT